MVAVVVILVPEGHCTECRCFLEAVVRRLNGLRRRRADIRAGIGAFGGCWQGLVF